MVNKALPAAAPVIVKFLLQLICIDFVVHQEHSVRGIEFSNLLLLRLQIINVKRDITLISDYPLHYIHCVLLDRSLLLLPSIFQLDSELMGQSTGSLHGFNLVPFSFLLWQIID